MIGKFLADDEPPIKKKPESANSILNLPGEQKTADILELPENNMAERESAPFMPDESIAAIREQIENEPAAIDQSPGKIEAENFSPSRAALENLPPIGQANSSVELNPGEDNLPVEENKITPGESVAPPMDTAAETVAALDNAAPLEDLPQTNFEFSTFAAAPKKEKDKYIDDGFSTDETIRGSGLAWSAGIAFFGSIVFMMIVGWFADLLLGSKPWGIVGGIILGAIIGFIQFFRISSQIFKK